MESPPVLTPMLTGHEPFVVPALAGSDDPGPPEGGTTNKGRFMESPHSRLSLVNSDPPSRPAVDAPKAAGFAQPCPSQRRGCIGVFLVLGAMLLLAAGNLAAAAVEASRGEITLPTYPWAAVKHPYFRGTDKVNIYPYPMLDFLSRDKTNRTYRTVVLENEYLRITFLPELGGKIHEVIDKTTGQPMFYVNHVIKPGLIGQCGAWTSGGVEWNTGPQGHTVSCHAAGGRRDPAAGDGRLALGGHRRNRAHLRHEVDGRRHAAARTLVHRGTHPHLQPHRDRPALLLLELHRRARTRPGFRFIYPMTLGTDHGAEKFFNWPIHEGKDLSRGTNYQDASSIFAWHCDQDFFGSYDDGADRGVVSYANHHQVPGKKAWTWGQGGFGTMHQMDLTDTDGPYNEVQTGPLLTQGEVGRLDPCEAVEWKEWWYPVHGIGGFTFANKDVAVNASRDAGTLHLRMLPTRTWEKVAVTIRNGKSPVGSETCKLSPLESTDVRIAVGTNVPRFEVSIAGKAAGTQKYEGLAWFLYPLALPKRTPPTKSKPPQTAAEFAEAGWRNYLFAKFPEAEAHFRQALDKDPKCSRGTHGPGVSESRP